MAHLLWRFTPRSRYKIGFCPLLSLFFLVATHGCIFQADDIDERVACRDERDCLSGRLCIQGRCTPAEELDAALPEADLGPDMAQEDQPPPIEEIDILYWNVEPQRFPAERDQSLAFSWEITGGNPPLDTVAVCNVSSPEPCFHPQHCHIIKEDAERVGSYSRNFSFPVDQIWSIKLLVEDEGTCVFSSKSIDVEVYEAAQRDGGVHHD